MSERCLHSEKGKTMDVREKLVELLCKMISPTITIGEQADFLIANGVTVQEWIPVTERLPKELHFVVAARKDGNSYSVDSEYFLNGTWVKDFKTGTRVTHWMEFPEPPKGE